ncbi:MAG: extracellular solute-binding protein [Candidatus Pristimantibacillus lignocellulolyticus]|uniref:Extracellular solute-binding protein n=1 Tax=Candidatus Pristimantibacillus lignocellulolyticus TaxID=2994561 RepID=A0A9J6Z9N5_9BACL|nr:MAG: extracellular solute-binding protein [Candidatus Pristimantibacillus lignocellulolyticus]
MKKNMNKGIFLALVIIMITSVLAACGSNNGKNPATTPNNSGNTPKDGNSATENKGAYRDKYDPPITISTAWGIDPELKFKNNETMENNVATKWALDTLGIEIKSLWSVTDSNNAFETKMRLSLNSANEIPDVVTIGTPQLAHELIDSGLFREAGSLFDEYASDTWKNAMALDDNVWNPYTRDGDRMGIPVLDYAYNHDYLLWIRQDWLDALKLEAPKTIAELENVMEQFKNNNPDGLAPADVTPLSMGTKMKLNTWMGDPSWIFGAFGTLPEQWNQAEDGTLAYGSIQPGMKEGLALLRDWHSKGYIPKEIALWDENQTSVPAVAGTAGIIAGPYWMSGWPLSDTAANAPNAVWKPLGIPTGEDGTAMRHGTHYTNGVTLISTKMKNPEAFFTYQNYLFENFADPKVGSEFENGLFKNYDFDIAEDGTLLRYDDIPGGYVNSVRYLLVRDGARIPDAQMKALMNLASGAEPTTRLEKEVKAAYGLETPAAAVVLLEQEAISFKDMFTGPPTETMNTKLDYLKKIELTTFNEIIYGNKDISAFDDFVAQWKAEGGDQITKEVNEWYNGIK